LQPFTQGAQGRRQLVGRKRKPPAQIERRGGVVQAEGNDAHGVIVRFARFRRDAGFLTGIKQVPGGRRAFA
jgi:hypothetical protein